MYNDCNISHKTMFIDKFFARNYVKYLYKNTIKSEKSITFLDRGKHKNTGYGRNIGN